MKTVVKAWFQQYPNLPEKVKKVVQRRVKRMFLKNHGDFEGLEKDMKKNMLKFAESYQRLQDSGDIPLRESAASEDASKNFDPDKDSGKDFADRLLSKAMPDKETKPQEEEPVRAPRRGRKASKQKQEDDAEAQATAKKLMKKCKEGDAGCEGLGILLYCSNN